MSKRKNKQNKKTEAQAENRSSPGLQKRSILAAIRDRFTNDWAEITSLNRELQQGLVVLRDRSRGLSINNEFARRYLKLIKTNVVGPEGVQVSVQATNLDGSPDTFNDQVEWHFYKWMEPENCTVTGDMDFVKVQELVLESVARDGECLVWFRRGTEFGPYCFQLQILDSDHLDPNYNATTTTGNEIIQGVEVNSYGRPIALWIWQNNPNDPIYKLNQAANARIRLSTDDLRLLFDPERASQRRGLPWMTTAMIGLEHVVKFREATLISARLGASKQLYYTQGEGQEFDDLEQDDMGNITMESNPGSHEVLPRGWDVKPIDFNAPTDKLGDFQKHVLRGVAASLGISYNSLAADLESVNYSSARFGGLEDQAQYRSIQRWFINAFVKPAYQEWLKVQLLTNYWGLNIPMAKYDKFCSVNYRPRSYQSIDPLKDTNADIALIKAGLTSYTDVIAKRGGDAEAVFKQIAKDKEVMAKLGITPMQIIDELVAQKGLDSGTENSSPAP